MINEGGTGIVRQEEMDSILDYEKQALEIGREVNIDELDKKYPKLGSSFNNNFLNGIALYIEGMKTGSVSKAIEGQNLKSKWDSWYIDHLGKIKSKLKTN